MILKLVVFSKRSIYYYKFIGFAFIVIVTIIIIVICCCKKNNRWEGNLLDNDSYNISMSKADGMMPDRLELKFK